MDISILKKRFFPRFLETEAPIFIDFFQTFLAWFSLDDNPYSNIENLSLNRDMDTAVDEYMLMLRHELMVDFPAEFMSDLRWIMHNLIRLYQVKGNEHSFKIFFKAAFNSVCKLSYPRDNILKASDGVWTTGCYIHPQDTTAKTMMTYIGRPVKCSTTGVSGIISDAVPHYFTATPSKFDYALVVTNYEAMFSVGDVLAFTDNYEDTEDTDEETFTVDKVDSASTAGGYWTGDNGRLDSSMVLQDSNYYQMFSYVLETGVHEKDYGNIVNKILHPAGWKRFGIYNSSFIPNADGTVTGVYQKNKPSLAFVRWLITILLQENLYSASTHLRSFLYNTLIGNTMSINTVFQGFRNQDWYQKYGKLHYGFVDSYQSKTAFDFDTEKDESGKLVFSSEGTLVDADFNSCVVQSSDVNYSVFSIINNAPKLKLKLKSDSNGFFVEHEYIGKYGTPFLFHNGLHVKDSRVSKSGSKIYITEFANSNVGDYVICYSLDPYFLIVKGSGDDIDDAVLNRETVFLVFDSDGNRISVDDIDDDSEFYKFANRQEITDWTIDNTSESVNRFRYPQKRHVRNVGCIRHDDARLLDRTLMHMGEAITRKQLATEFNKNTYMLFNDIGLLLDPFDSKSLDIAKYCVVLKTYSPTQKITVDETGKIKVGVVARTIANYNRMEIIYPWRNTVVADMEGDTVSDHDKMETIYRWKDTRVMDMVMYATSLFIFVDGYKLTESMLVRNNLDEKYVYLSTNDGEYDYYSKDAIVYFIDTVASEWDSNDYTYSVGEIESGDEVSVGNIESFLPFVDRRAACRRMKYGTDKKTTSMLNGNYEFYEFNNYTGARIKYVV